MGLDVFEFAQLEEPEHLHVEAAAQPAEPAVDHVAEAMREADGIREAARADGYAAGLEAARVELAPAAAALAAACDEVRATGEGLADALERAAVDLALRIAEQALHAAVAADPEHVVGAVRGALRRLVERDRTLVLVNPADLELVRGATAGLVSELGGIEHCEVQAERRVERGGAIVRTAEGEVDATLETKLERAREVLEQELAGGE
jgi:flagellar assembly protein FliH